MVKTFTQNDLIRYLFEELPEREKHLISILIETDKEFQTQYQELLLTKQLLEQEQLEPSEQAVNKILEFSRNYTTCQV